MTSDFPVVPVSNGDLLDRHSILEIKSRLVADPEGRVEVVKEMSAIRSFVEKVMEVEGVRVTYLELLDLNERIWFAMEEIFELREIRNERYFLAVDACIDLNVERALLKRRINDLSRSALREVKSYFSNEGSGG